MSVVGTADDGKDTRLGTNFETRPQESSRRSHRIPVIEGLGDRRVTADLLHDVALSPAAIADSRGVSLHDKPVEILMQVKI